MSLLMNNQRQYSMDFNRAYQNYIKARLQYENGLIDITSFKKIASEFKESKSAYSRYIKSCEAC